MKKTPSLGPVTKALGIFLNGRAEPINGRKEQEQFFKERRRESAKQRVTESKDQDGGSPI